MNTWTYTLSFVISLVLEMAIIPVVINYARRKQLFDEPGARKKHTEKVSSLGGIGIFIAWAISAGMLLVPQSGNTMAAFALALPLFILAIIDDIHTVGVTTRLVFQALTAVLAFELGFKLELIENAWLLNLGATVFVTMAMINAFNLIDGINGLSGILGTVASVAFGWYFFSNGYEQLAIASFAYAGALVGFLRFNFGNKAKIFMGDNGSVVLGYFMALMTIATIKIGNTPNGDLATAFQLSFGVIALPMADMVKVSVGRIFSGNPPFYGDRTHVHHLYVDNDVSHPVASIILGTIQLTTVVLAVILESWVFWFIAPVLILAPYVIANLFVLVKSRSITTPSRNDAERRVPA
ncbi:MAG: MraY family glycosyltransferase [Saprospiraceae bacterium]